MFACEHASVKPDIMTLGKGIGGGVPLSALLASERATCFAQGDQGGTYCGNPLMAAVGSAVIDRVSQPQFLEGVRLREEHLVRRLREVVQRRALAGERGRGLLRAIDLGQPVAAQVVDAARDLTPDGLLLNAPRPHLLRLMPALNIEFEAINRMIGLLDQALARVLG
jgi:acetylornithine/N-succinyldiaminopimelate aminotransferase